MLIFHLKKKKKKKKQGRENIIIDKMREKLLQDNDDTYVKYNPEDNSYELKTNNEKGNKEYIIKGLYALNKKLKKN